MICASPPWLPVTNSQNDFPEIRKQIMLCSVRQGRGDMASKIRRGMNGGSSKPPFHMSGSFLVCARFHWCEEGSTALPGTTPPPPLFTVCPMDALPFPFFSAHCCLPPTTAPCCFPSSSGKGISLVGLTCVRVTLSRPKLLRAITVNAHLAAAQNTEPWNSVFFVVYVVSRGICFCGKHGYKKLYSRVLQN